MCEPELFFLSNEEEIVKPDPSTLTKIWDTLVMYGNKIIKFFTNNNNDTTSTQSLITAPNNNIQGRAEYLTNLLMSDEIPGMGSHVKDIKSNIINWWVIRLDIEYSVLVKKHGTLNLST
jgi:hypothetical protein